MTAPALTAVSALMLLHRSSERRLDDIRGHLEPASIAAAELSRTVAQRKYDRGTYSSSGSENLLAAWREQFAIA